nr:acetyl-CoA carboxylase carboxyltransferase beta, chloroplastic [Tanacetum cinerariifolium]
MTPVTRQGPNIPPNNTNPNNMTLESFQAMIDQALLQNSTNGDRSHSSYEDNRRNIKTTRPCFYADFMILAGTDLELSAGTDLELSAGTDLELSAGTDLELLAGTDLEMSAGTDLERTAGTDLERTAGTDILLAVEIDLATAAGTDLELSAGTDLELSAGTDLELSAGTDLEMSAGTDLERTAGTDLERTTGTDIDIYVAGSENRPPMLNKENYVPWSSRLLRYAKSRPNGKLIHNSILNGPYVRRMIPEPGDANRDVNVTETFHEKTDDEISEKELK